MKPAFGRCSPSFCSRFLNPVSLGSFASRSASNRLKVKELRKYSETEDSLPAVGFVADDIDLPMADHTAAVGTIVDVLAVNVVADVLRNQVVVGGDE